VRNEIPIGKTAVDEKLRQWGTSCILYYIAWFCICRVACVTSTNPTLGLMCFMQCTKKTGEKAIDAVWLVMCAYSFLTDTTTFSMHVCIQEA